MQALTGRTDGPARFSARRTVWLLGLLLLLLAGLGGYMALGSASASLVLEVVAEPERHVLSRLPAVAGDRFELRFLHSVEQTEVVEYFRIESDRSLVLEGTLYHSQGVGLPFDEEGDFTITPEGMRWQNLNRRLQQLQLRPVSFTEHVLIKDDQIINLSDPQWAGKRLVIRVRPGRAK